MDPEPPLQALGVSIESETWTAGPRTCWLWLTGETVMIRLLYFGEEKSELITRIIFLYHSLFPLGNSFKLERGRGGEGRRGRKTYWLKGSLFVFEDTWHTSNRNGRAASQTPA